MIGRVGRISTDIDVSTVTPFKASYDNTTVGLSAEVGHRFDLSQIFYVTPQAELAYGRVFGDDYSGSNGMKVSQDDFDTLIARIGFQAGANFADNRGSIYLTASVNHDFLGDTEATASKAGAQDQKLKEDLGRHLVLVWGSARSSTRRTTSPSTGRSRVPTGLIIRRTITTPSAHVTCSDGAAYQACDF